MLGLRVLLLLTSLAFFIVAAIGAFSPSTLGANVLGFISLGGAAFVASLLVVDDVVGRVRGRRVVQ